MVRPSLVQPRLVPTALHSRLAHASWLVVRRRHASRTFQQQLLHAVPLHGRCVMVSRSVLSSESLGKRHRCCSWWCMRWVVVQCWRGWNESAWHSSRFIRLQWSVGRPIAHVADDGFRKFPHRQYYVQLVANATAVSGRLFRFWFPIFPHAVLIFCKCHSPLHNPPSVQGETFE
jgi:hypothetical protein